MTTIMNVRVVLMMVVTIAIVIFAVLSSYYKYIEDSTMNIRFDSIERSSVSKEVWTLNENTKSSDYVTERSNGCENLLLNLTHGKWVVYNESLAREIDDVYKSYWSKRGIQNQWERQDGKCGYNNLQDKVKGSTWPRVGSWCDPHGNKPCCSDLMNGDCRAPSNESCSCSTCVDTRLYKIAEAAHWKPTDARCQWERLAGDKACKVIENSPFSDIHYVGDSFVRNMFAGLMMLLSNDTYKGAWSVSITEEQKERCHGVEFFFWDYCRSIIFNVTQLLTYNSLCSGNPPKFTASVHEFYNTEFANDFLTLVKSGIGKRGTLVVVGVGIHMGLNPTTTINQYLLPAVNAINDHYSTTNETRWPKLIYVIPMPSNLLKPTEYAQAESHERLAAFSGELRTYCAMNGIPVLDFRNLARFAQSFDGGHNGVGVNLMKNQILLNYIKSL